MKSIVVGTDGSETAKKALDEASDLAKAVGAKLHIVSAYEPDSSSRLGDDAPPEASWTVGPDVSVDSVLEQAEGAMHAKGVDADSHARRGPADVLLEVAEEEDADLIVVGNKGMTGAKRFLLGSVPNKVSHHAPCSVLIVRTTEPPASW